MRKLALALIFAACLALPASASAFGIEPPASDFTDSLGAPATQAGSHPYAWDTTISFQTAFNEDLGDQLPIDSPRDVRVSAPAGLIANPTVAPACTTLEFLSKKCPVATQVGVSDVTFSDPTNTERVSVYNLPPPVGVAAKLGFYVTSTVPVTIEGTVNPNPPFNVIASVNYISQTLPLYATRTTIWGDPADPAHDADRGGAPAGIPERAFLTMPRSCPADPLRTDFAADSWEDPAPCCPTGRPTPPTLTGSPTAPARPPPATAPRSPSIPRSQPPPPPTSPTRPRALTSRSPSMTRASPTPPSAPPLT